MASSRRCGSWAYNWECLGPSGPGRAPPGPSPGTNPQTAGDMDRLTELHMVGLDGDQLDSLPESSGQLGWETVSKPCPGEPSRLDHIGAPAGGEDTSITSMRQSIVDVTVVLGLDWARTDRLPSIRGFRPGVLGGARRKVAQEWHRDWGEKLVKHGIKSVLYIFRLNSSVKLDFGHLKKSEVFNFKSSQNGQK